MAEKLSWTELRRALAARAGVSEKKAGAFLNAFQGQLIEALKSDNQVKINGLGTFKVQAVAPRKSVNVATGEDIIIEGYNKLTFAPEAGVRELIEKGAPVSEPATESGETPVLDPLKKLGAQAEEIVDILGDLGQSPVEKEPEVEPEPVVEPEPEPVVIPEPEPVIAPEPEPVVAPKKPKKESHFMRDTLICVVILLLLLLIGYFFLRQQLSSIIDSFLQPSQKEVVTDTVAQNDPSAETVEQAEDGTISQEQILAEFMAVSNEEESGQRYPDLITTEPMHEASRLAWMAKRFYGAKIYWPYLYDANRDVLENPCLIQVGTPIRVPKLTKQQLDTTNAQTAALLEQLRIEAEEACGK